MGLKLAFPACRINSVKLTISRSVHIHARVGYDQGPQVPHPAAPEYQQELLTHTRWWREIYQHRSKEGAECLSVTTEFGPPNYLHTLPFSNEPVANLWEVCDWMRQFIAAEIDTNPSMSNDQPTSCSSVFSITMRMRFFCASVP
ncbi:hypothetical protein [Paenibacillus sp. Y412MC10]|uniref:hypothetical protein n=1 Tax=Geobacillus sp. (strain Y412MC10) TaxID=481743 RepID=UPI00119F5E81|nr:hypothetical protein [Paenibacillus sp. Y412MC10]